MTFGCWAVFAGFWYLICFSHGDLNFDKNGMRLNEGKMPCVEGVVTLTGFFLMSFEVQVTVVFVTTNNNDCNKYQIEYKIFSDNCWLR